MNSITELESWLSLSSLSKKAESKAGSSSILTNSPIKKSIISTQHIRLDYSHQQINDNCIQHLLRFAEERQLPQQITALFRGDTINISEQRPALHTALRCINSQPKFIDGKDISIDIQQCREQISTISQQIRSGQWIGFKGKPITAIVHIGIGGSDLGPRFCMNALKEFSNPDLSYHFVSDIDPNSFEHATTQLHPDTTLFIIASKSFTTQETIYNMQKAIAFIGNGQKMKHSKENFQQHFIAITANKNKAEQLGISTILPIWDWIGGRYSLTSAINLITAIAIGYDRFTELLAGANSMDRHFRFSPLHDNMPVMLALLGLWNINFLQIPSLLMLVYARQLENFVPFVQQLDMESNGKSFDIQGKKINYATAPIVWGGSGNQAQHSYYQLLCQGTHRIAADFISVNNYENEMINNFCKTTMTILSQGVDNGLKLTNTIKGHMPINHICLKSLDPFCIGELIALYENKVFAQAALWGINPFDQPGVESAKSGNTQSNHFNHERGYFSDA